MNLGEISKSVSRVHACILLSPAFWNNYEASYPSYFKKLGNDVPKLPGHLLYSIWEFVRPAKKILLKDFKSKTGIFKKVVQPLKINTGISLNNLRL